MQFTCGSCKDGFTSAWALLQHAQANHGLKIYEEVIRHRHHYRDHLSEPSGGRPPMANTSPSPAKDDKAKPKPKRENSESSPTPKPKEERPIGPHQSPTSLHSKTLPQQPRPASSPPPMNMGMGMLSQAPPTFMFRMPGLGGEHPPISPVLVNNSPFSRPPHCDFMNDPFQRFPGIPPSFEPPPTAIPGFPNPFERLPRHPLSPAVPLEGSALDFYSQRLRQLAGTNSPSPHSPSPKHTAQFPGQLPPFSKSPTATSPTPAIDGSPKSSSGAVTPGKAKACEFCGKCFRFQSNLIVHRRSHTGEKPFKCPMCPHACTQASKLKRHMKTHSSRHHGMSSSLSQASSMSTGSENSMRSSSSTPDSKLSKGEGESEESDSEDEEHAMEEARKMGAIQDEPTDLSAPHPVPKKLEFSFEDESNEIPTDLSVGEKPSLLSEVMENTGLNSIQAYSEAFKQALAESTRRLQPKPGHGETITENGHSEAEPGSLEHSSKAIGISQDHDCSPDSKRIKLEPQEQNLPPNSMEPFFSRIWFPPTGSHRDFFINAMLPHSGMGSPDQMLPIPHSNENGMHGHHQDSAYSVESLVHSPKPSTSLSALGLAPSLASSPTVSNPSSLVGIRSSKEQRRNDTCEFCGKVFKNCSNLTVHRRSHTGEKPYRCELCSYACAQSSKLTRHMKTHGRMGKDVYRCKFCNMPFSVPSTLEKHMRKCVENQNAGSVSASSTPGTNSLGSSASPALSKMDHIE